MQKEHSSHLNPSFYPWKRRWIPADRWEHRVGLGDDFLEDWQNPLAEEIGFIEPLLDIRPLESFASVPLLLLLGRPGSGKSQEIDSAASHHWLGKSILIKGKEIGAGNPGQAIQREIEATVSPEHRPGLRILIDGLDEVLLQNLAFIPQLTSWMRLLRNAEGNPLYTLAITCRWADWPEAEIKALTQLWPKESYQTLVLCPLRRIDAEKTLEDSYGRSSAELFWKLIRDRHLQPVACWPQGFKDLMSSFESKSFQDIPDSLGDAVRGQVRRLCRLADTRDDRLRWSNSSQEPEWCQRVAGRLAAAMTWSGKADLALEDFPHHDSPPLHSTELTKTEEPWSNKKRSVTENDFNQLVDLTGLLKRLSNRRWAFHSQIYQEWLASDWLVAQNLDEPRLRLLFGASTDLGWKVFPALKSVAAWLARMDSTFRTLLLKEDPLVLLRLDAASLPAKDREDIIESILKATAIARVVDSSVWQAHLHSLIHKGLDSQIRRWITDENIHETAKDLAVEIAEKTKLKSLVPLFWDLYPQATERMKDQLSSALYALSDSPEYDDKWKAVLNGDIPIDSNGDMLGAALEILVKNRQAIPVRDILDKVLPPIDFGVIGLYRVVTGQLHNQIKTQDLPAVFSHLEKNLGRLHSSDWKSALRSFNDRAIQLAFQSFDQPQTALVLVDYWHTCIKDHVYPHHWQNQGWTPEAIGLENDSLRRKIVRALILHPQFERTTKRKWVYGSDYLVIKSDFEWCLDEILASNSSEEEWPFALLAVHLLSSKELSDSLGVKLLQAWQKSEFLQSLIPTASGKNVLETIDMQIATVEKAEQDKNERLKHQLSLKAELLNKDIIRRTEQLKEKHEQGKIVWPRVYELLAAREHGLQSYTVTFGLEDQVGKDEEWIRETARRYLIERPYLESLSHYEGLSALMALAVCPQDLSPPGPVADSVMNHWLPSLIKAMTESALEKESAGLTRRNLAELFPQPFVEAFSVVMRERYISGAPMTDLYHYQAFWTSAMTQELTTLLKNEPVHATGFVIGLRFLFTTSEQHARDVANHWLNQLSGLGEENKLTIIGTISVMLDGCMFDQVKQWLSDPQFAKPALAAAFENYRERHMDFINWVDQPLLDLANVCWNTLPQIESWSSGGRWLSAEDRTKEFRNDITAACRSRGLLVNIPSYHPDDDTEQAEKRREFVDWNRHVTFQAQATKRRQFLMPQTFFSLTHRPHARLARTDDELMQAVKECLQRWEKSLESGSWDHLWDLAPIKSRPEKRIAVEMREWLKKELDITVECEVELAAGTRTDILVQTTPTDISILILSVIIEVKKTRSSNKPEWLTAMETQLRDRYLAKRQHEKWTHGLFVVAWTPEPRSKDDSVEAIQKASIELAAQAKSLTQPPFHLHSMVIDARYQNKPVNKGNKATKKAVTKRKFPLTPPASSSCG